MTFSIKISTRHHKFKPNEDEEEKGDEDEGDDH